MVVTDNGEPLIHDTAVDEADSKELLTWIENSLKCKPKGIIVIHFRIDCLGGLSEFHKAQIPSYANDKTIELAKSTAVTLPQTGFDNFLVQRLARRKC